MRNLLIAARNQSMGPTVKAIKRDEGCVARDRQKRLKENVMRVHCIMCSRPDYWLRLFPPRPDPSQVSVSTGINWLISAQGPDGGWGQDGGATSHARQGDSQETNSNDVANTASAVMALVHSGHTAKGAPIRLRFAEASSSFSVISRRARRKDSRLRAAGDTDPAQAGALHRHLSDFDAAFGVGWPDGGCRSEPPGPRRSGEMRPED